jgi:hypothetical protein
LAPLHSDPFAFKAFVAAVATLTERSKPQGAPVLKINPNDLGDVFFRRDASAAEIGQQIAGMALYQEKEARDER